MKRRTLWLLLLVLVMVSGSAVRAQSDLPGDAKILPRYQTPEELATEADLGGAGMYPWECNPALYGFTPPSELLVRFPSEFEQTSGVLIGWPSWGCQIPEMTDLIRHGIGRTTVTVITNLQSSVVSCLRGRGFTDEDLAQVTFTPSPIGLNTIWIRDYGPEILEDEAGGRLLIDMSYYPGPTSNCANIQTRPLDDASPTRLTMLGGGKWDVPVHRPQVRAEGGAIQTDGNGTCFRTQRVMEARNRFSRWVYTPEELDGVFFDYYGCNMVVLESLVGGVIDHEDMWMTVISPTKILVGRYDPADDLQNSAILDRNAQRLEELGYNVVRVPMPKPYCSDGGFPAIRGRTRLCNSTYESRRVWATYVNSIQVGNAMRVPIYRDVPESVRAEIEGQEAEALAIFQQELDAEFGIGAIEVIPAESDTMITGQGSVHCVAMTYK